MDADERKHIGGLLSLLGYANSRDDGQWVNDIYRSAQNTLRLILEDVYGRNAADDIIERFAEICGGFTMDELDEAIRDTADAPKRD